MPPSDPSDGAAEAGPLKSDQPRTPSAAADAARSRAGFNDFERFTRCMTASGAFH